MCETSKDKSVTQLLFIKTINSNSLCNTTDQLWRYCTNRTLHTHHYMYQAYTTPHSTCSYLFVDVSRSLSFSSWQCFEFRCRPYSTNTLRQDGKIKNCFKHDNPKLEIYYWYIYCCSSEIDKGNKCSLNVWDKQGQVSNTINFHKYDKFKLIVQQHWSASRTSYESYITHTPLHVPIIHDTSFNVFLPICWCIENLEF